HDQAGKKIGFCKDQPYTIVSFMQKMFSVLHSFLDTAAPPVFIHLLVWIPLQYPHRYTRPSIIHPISDEFLGKIEYGNDLSIYRLSINLKNSPGEHPGMQLPGSLIFTFVQDYFVHLHKNRKLQRYTLS